MRADKKIKNEVRFLIDFAYISFIDKNIKSITDISIHLNPYDKLEKMFGLNKIDVSITIDQNAEKVTPNTALIAPNTPFNLYPI